MKFSRLAALALAVAALLPGIGAADQLDDAIAGLNFRTMTDQACTIGHPTLTSASGVWIATAGVNCIADRAYLRTSFSVIHAQGVGTHPRPGFTGNNAFNSVNPSTGQKDYDCIGPCKSVSATGFRVGLAPGVYSMRVSGTTVNSIGGPVGDVTTHDEYLTCFVIINSTTARFIPHCGV